MDEKSFQKIGVNKIQGGKKCPRPKDYDDKNINGTEKNG